MSFLLKEVCLFSEDNSHLQDICFLPLQQRSDTKYVPTSILSKAFSWGRSCVSSPHLCRKKKGRNNIMVPGFVRLNVSEGAIPAFLIVSGSNNFVIMDLWKRKKIKIFKYFCVLCMIMSKTLISRDICKEHTGQEKKVPKHSQLS